MIPAAREYGWQRNSNLWAHELDTHWLDEGGAENRFTVAKRILTDPGCLSRAVGALHDSCTLLWGRIAAWQSAGTRGFRRMEQAVDAVELFVEVLDGELAGMIPFVRDGASLAVMMASLMLFGRAFAAT